MFSRSMRTAVLQATTLFAVSMLLGEHMSDGMFDQVVQNEGWLNMTNAIGNSTTRHSPVRPKLAAGNATSAFFSRYQINGTALNGTAPTWTAEKGTFSPMKDPSESFYGRKLPRRVAVYLLLSALQYWWYLALEKMLPARPRPRVLLSDQRVEKAEESEDREEEVVKKWIAQGRVYRASLNWCNTFLKWILDMTIGRLWYHAVEHVLDSLFKLQSPKKIVSRLMSHIRFSMVVDWLSPLPLINLVAFITIPAHQRIVFLAGAELITTIFLYTIVRVFAAWAVKTDFAQAVMRNITENVGNPRFKSNRFAKLNDEL